MLSTSNEKHFSMHISSGYDYRIAAATKPVNYPKNLFIYGASLGKNASKLIKLYYRFNGDLDD